MCAAPEVLGVAAMPGIPISVAYCQSCLTANAHPLKLVIINTALYGGYDESAGWWQQLVDDTLEYLRYPRDLFDIRVQKAIQAEMEDECDVSSSGAQ